MAILKCEDLSFAYEGRQVLNDVNFTLSAGNYLCVLGENGSGKSTLIKGLLGLKSPESGKIIFGEGLKSTEIGYLPQQTAMQKDFPASVYEVVLSGCLSSLGKRRWYNKEDKKKAMENMERMGIEDIKDKSYQSLSGGQQQRVLLARALCATKKLLLLDEPVTGLDPIATGEMY
ncbi:zinc ABC transporter, ATP-binding protein, partial [gut metagenome]